MAFTPRQYRSHMDRKRGCPPRSQHFSVTCPFCTRFILKPTVGIELWDGIKVSEVFFGRVVVVGCHRRTPHQRIWLSHEGGNVLEGEFSALSIAEKSVLARRKVWGAWEGEQRGKLTAKTLNNEVFPAFCKPIIVISISVALRIEAFSSVPSSSFLLRGEGVRILLFPANDGSHNLGLDLRQAGGTTHQNNLNSQSYIRLKRPAMMLQSEKGRSGEYLFLSRKVGCCLDDGDARGYAWGRMLQDLKSCSRRKKSC